ncbi:Meiotically up-regulated protein [Escovopsis weberi]|uniref:Meiotically up-regulated protein n=1 Tax=Escovopsis weberi TaxID=150374 RepID=A0A0M8N4P0_ESCWE|nr:Meiotically up-regulated protein [Escovopsis weberi]
MLLYDQEGLQLFEDITYLDEYYLTNAEIEILEEHCLAIAKAIPERAMIVELGSGSLRKTSILLSAFDRLHKQVDYFALDLSLPELQRTLNALPEFTFVNCHGLRGTYDDGREWLKRPAFHNRPKCVIQLGSSIGNFSRKEAAGFLQGFAQVLKPVDMMILGIDSCAQPDKVYRAYNDSEGVTHKFILNGLQHANELFGSEVFRVNDWRVIGEYIYDEEGGRHQAFVSPVRDTYFGGTVISPHERVKIEQSLKYSKLGLENLWLAGGLDEINRWSTNNEYGVYLLRKSQLPFCRHPHLYAAKPFPILYDWRSLWATWDHVTQVMLPAEALLDKPISLRNPFIFYLGHIPCFLDTQLFRVSGQGHPQIQRFREIFERGIDPDVDNPELCHSHSEIPDQWPPPEEIIEYQGWQRRRVLSLYTSTRCFDNDEWMRRALWTAFEHEIMHLETLLYMMLQSDKVLSPQVTPKPDFEAMAARAREARVPNQWFDIPEQIITVGLDDPEGENHPRRHFGWDNEKPARQVHVPAFQAKGRAITNEEYARYLCSGQGGADIPASWVKRTVPSHVQLNSGKFIGDIPIQFLLDKGVRTVFGIIPLRQALDWPVIASYDELAGCAAWMGGRIPTAEEARSIYAYVENDRQQQLAARSMLARYITTDDDQTLGEDPPVPEVRPLPLHIDLEDANIGFKNWHPVSITSRGNRLAGQGDLGGVWEWTSTVFAKHEGFQPMELYQLYSQDFFDGKHNIVLGGSWATHPRVAGRRTFVNWYQRNYPYAWVGARLVRDMPQ